MSQRLTELEESQSQEPTATESTTATVTLEEARNDPVAFRRRLLVDRDGESVSLGEVLDDWQRADFEAMDNAWRRIVGKFRGECCARAYLERPKGHSKTTDLAAMALWALFAAPRKIVGVSAAAAKPQAKLMRDAIDTILRLNPWLWAEIRVNNYEVKNPLTGSTFTILASNERSSHGPNPDFVICDEVTHWADRDLWDSLYAAAGKRANCLLLAIANAGDDQGVGWKWAIREACRLNSAFYFHRLEGPVASWMTAERLADQAKGISAHAYKRLWLNLWSRGSDEGLPPENVEACIVLDGPVMGETHHYDAVIGALDIGLTHDHASFVALGISIQRRRFGLLQALRWRPEDFPGKRILLAQVEADVITECRRLRVTGVAFDPYQCERSAEELARTTCPIFPTGIPCYRYEFTPKNLAAMAKSLVSAFTNRTIDLYREPSLIVDLLKIVIVERGMVYRIEGVKDEQGHCDLATALAIALPWAEGTLATLLEGVAA